MLFGCHVNRYHAAHKRGEAAPTLAAHIRAAAAEAAAECGAALRSAQVFVGGPGRREITLTAAEAAELRELAAGGGGAAPVRLFAHSVYVAPPWGGDPDAARFIRDELAVCARAGICGLVVHLPKAPIATVVKYAPRLINPDARGVRIFLETPAVTPPETYYESPEKLGALLAALREVDPADELFGLCVDTAHLWTSGVDLRSRAAAADWLARLAAQFARLALPDLSARLAFHANDSARPRGVGPDAHAGFPAGLMWGEFFAAGSGLAAPVGLASGLAAFAEFAAAHRCAFILERKPKEALRADFRIMAALEPSAALAPAAPAPAAAGLAAGGGQPALEPAASGGLAALSTSERAQVWVRAAALALSPAEGRARAGRSAAARQRLLGALLEPSLSDAQRLGVLAAGGRLPPPAPLPPDFVARAAELAGRARAAKPGDLLFVAHAAACCAPPPAESARALARALGLAGARVCVVSQVADAGAPAGGLAAADPVALTFERCGAASLPAEAADVCALLLTAHHARPLLAAAAGALRRGGLLLLCEFARAGGSSAAVDCALFDVAHALYSAGAASSGPHPCAYLSADEWAAAARECGLEEVARAQKDAPLPLVHLLFRKPDSA